MSSTGRPRFTTLIDAATLAGLLARPAEHAGLVLLDCRFDLTLPDAGRLAYRAAHLPGARYADLNRDLSGPITPGSGRHPLPDPAALRAFLRRAGIGATQPAGAAQVVAYDEGNGSIAARAWWLLRWLGMAQVAVLDGGFRAWVAGGNPIESGAPEAGDAAGRNDAAPAPASSPAPLVEALTAGQVELALQDPRRLLVDARAPERFAGTVEPLDPVAGHVPGAVNHPFAQNLAADGRFLAADELRRRWLERLDGRAPADMIAMCGSGVTACHNLLAMHHAGLPGGRLYAGSWSEWIRDTDRPVARGGRP
jgi:thiosulfate/3-mercaptopyruvate sulfurtransferase